MKNILNNIINIVASAVMIFFAIPKLLAKPQSVAGFEQFEKVIYLNADVFRIFTGIAEFGIAILLLAFLFSKNHTIGKLAYLILLLTMITALGLEFFARPEPKMLLVIIAIILASASAYRLKSISHIQKS